MEKEIYQIEPIVLYPTCILETGKQNDCRKCEYKDVCITYQPRCMCIRPYKNHPEGCPNFGKKPGCPPNVPMYDQIFDKKTEKFAIVTKYNLAEYYRQRRERRPDLAEGQIRNSRCWQPTTKKENDIAIGEFFQENPEMSNYVATRFLECMGVDVIGTMRNVGLKLTFPVEDIVYRVAFVAEANDVELEKCNYEICMEKSGLKKGMRSLVIKK